MRCIPGHSHVSQAVSFNGSRRGPSFRHLKLASHRSAAPTSSTESETEGQEAAASVGDKARKVRPKRPRMEVPVVSKPLKRGRSIAHKALFLDRM